MHSVEDVASDVGYLYSYDGDGRVEGYTQYKLSDKTNTLAINYKYDEESRLFEAVTTMDYYVGENKADWRLLEQFNYDENDLLDIYIALFENTNANMLEGTYDYDAIQRLDAKTYELSKGTSSVQNLIDYEYDDVNGKYSSRVKTYTTTIGSNTSTYTYSYDPNGNITRIIETRSDGSSYTTKYTYDDLNQLIREDNPHVTIEINDIEYCGITYVYAYDYNGNRASKTTYAYTTGTLGTALLTETYLYDESWGDLLIKYNGTSITYDAIGNPESYYYGESYTFSWTDGRRLLSASVDGKTLSFTYNDEGIRTSKTVDGVTHYYTLDGMRILTEQWGNIFIAYIYDENGAPIGMQYRTSCYTEDVFDYFYFEKNLQGDIIAVYNESGTKLVSYVYDAWGNHTAAYTNGGASTGAQYNPFRYRGYYYDNELGLYYLNSRYYDANTGRFISPDRIDVLGVTPDQLTDKNLYAYCDNNPITREDGDGEFWNVVIGAVVGAATAVIGQVVSDVVNSVLSGELCYSSWETRSYRFCNWRVSAGYKSKKCYYWKRELCCYL